MKKIIAILLSLVTLTSMSACCSSSGISGNSPSSEQIQAIEPAKPSEPIKLTNKMTENERASVDKHSLTLLDEPNKQGLTEHKVSVEFITVNVDDTREYFENNRDNMTDEEYEAAMSELKKTEEKVGKTYSYGSNILVDGYYVYHRIPCAEPCYSDYDGGQFGFYHTFTDQNGEPKTETLSFESFEDYLDWIREFDAEHFGYSESEIELDTELVRIANEAFRSGNYEVLPEGTDIDYSMSIPGHRDYRSEWEYDRDAVEAIKDSVDEISIYDDELCLTFTVHVTLPPNYDKDKTYPVFFLTDGIWRFGNCPELRKCMEDGEAAPVILVSLWYSYHIAYDKGYPRYEHLVIERDKLLDFITDNLMPYLGENYNIDCANSTLYGHSDGGVFAHNALFKSDKYENQPFGNYIIGSPAFWGLYYDYPGLDPEGYENDYGYFDRNDRLSKNVFLCAGSQEDPDYADKYNGRPTTLEGVAKFKERMESHGADLSYKLYDSHHYQYIPEMLVEYLKEKYPC